MAKSMTSTDLLLRLVLGLLLLLLGGLVVLLESIGGHAVQTDDRAVGVLDEDVLLDLVLLLFSVEGADTVDDSTDDTPSVAEVEVHLGSELTGLVADNTQDDVGGGGTGVGTRDETKLHGVSLGEDGLGSPAGELDAVVLHLGGHDSTALRPELAAPVQSATGAGGLAVELVESLDNQMLVLAADGILHDGVDLGTDDHVERLLVILQGQVEPSVLVSLGGKWFCLLGGVVEGVRVVEGDLGFLGFYHGLQSKVVVDECGFQSKSTGGVDRLLLAGRVGRLHRGICSILVDGDQIDGSTLALVEVDLVALVDDHDVPRVDTARSAHEHGQNVRGGEDGRLVLLGELLDNRILRSGDVVSGTFQGLQLALGVLDGGLVVRPVVVVEETIGVQILTLRSLKVQLGQPVEVNLLQHGPVGTDVDRRLTGSLRLVIVLPTKTTATVAACRAVVVVAIAALATTSTNSLEASATTSLADTTLTAATEDSATTTGEGTLGRCAGVVDNGEGRLILGDLDVEQTGGACAVNLLIWRGSVHQSQRRAGRLGSPL